MRITNGFSNHINVKVVAVPSSIETGFALPSMEEFEKKITSKTRAILICNPGNPTGLPLYKGRIAETGSDSSET